MTEDNRMPNFWWCPTHHLYRGGDQRPCASAVRLVPAPPAPRVFFPGDTVPAGTWVMNDSNTETRSLVGHPYRDWKVMFGPCVEIFGLPSPEEWQAAVDQADADRTEAQP